MNHYSMIRLGGLRMTACCEKVPANEANPAMQVTCPECRMRVAAKAKREADAVALSTDAQERHLHQATAAGFLAHL